eukprot:5142586-Prymnesium_polylepis.1
MMLVEAGQRVAERILARRSSNEALLQREADRVPRPMPCSQLRDDACVAERVEVREVIERRRDGDADGAREK